MIYYNVRLRRERSGSVVSVYVTATNESEAVLQAKLSLMDAPRWLPNFLTRNDPWQVTEVEPIDEC